MIDQRILKKFPLPERNIICCANVGSISHGTAGSVIDDEDIMGAFLPEPRSLYGVESFEHWDPVVSSDPELGNLDPVFYDIRKLHRLWLKGNPNVMCLLWMENRFYHFKSQRFFAPFIENREVYNSKLAYHALKGYARSQLHDMDKGVYKGYMGVKRKELVDKFGYDTKSAAHTVRILRMGIEYLETGEYNILRPDAEEIKKIKAGGWDRQVVLNEVDYLLKEMDKAAESSKLPELPDKEHSTQILMSVLRDWDYDSF